MTITEQVDADLKELRELADYFDRQRLKDDAHRLRYIATRYEVIAGAYVTQLGRETARQPHNSGEGQ